VTATSNDFVADVVLDEALVGFLRATVRSSQLPASSAVGVFTTRGW